MAGTGRAKSPRNKRAMRGKIVLRDEVQLKLNLAEDERRAALDYLRTFLANTELSDNVHFSIQSLYDKLSDVNSRRARWKFKMLNTERAAKVREEILDGEEPFVTLKVWNVLLENVEHNTGRVGLTRKQIAEKARTNVKAVSSATSRLEKVGAVQRRQDGRGVTYWIDPRIGWFGDFSERQIAMADYLERAEELIRRARTEPELPAGSSIN